MSTFEVPGDDGQPWPTLGKAICDLIEARAIHGPGDLRGEPAVIDQEKKALIYRAYEVYPRDHPRAGKRRFKRIGISLRKGTAKTELAAWIAFAELHPEGPVRTDGWRKDDDGVWVPVGRPVKDPYIPMVAYTEEQTEELAYGALLCMCSEGPDSDLFDSGLERIMRLHGDGKATALASAPDSRDGARTTFQHFDETHRFTLDRLVKAHRTMMANIPKRPIADPWSLETTTTYTPGEGSVAQGTHEYAELVEAGKAKDSTLFFFHREASDVHDIETPEGLRAAVVEASGPAIAKWEDFDGQVEAIMSLFGQPDTDLPYAERVWLNRRKQSSRQAFSRKRWDELAQIGAVIPTGDPLTIGFDGSRWKDSTGLVLTSRGGLQVPFSVWERDPTNDEWEVPEGEVDEAVDEIWDRYRVIRMYGDPAQGWDVALARWAGKYGQKKVAYFYTDSRNVRKTATACRAYAAAIKAGEVTHNGDETFARHIGATHRRDAHMMDEDQQPLWVIEKERHDSPKKIDLAMCGVLSWQARLDAMAADEFGDVDEYAYVM